MRTLRTHLILLGFGVVALAAAPAGADQPVERPTIAIVDFEATPAGTVLPPPHLGTTIAELMLDRLVASDHFRVLDGRWLQSGPVAANTPATFEALRAGAEASGVDYLVLGSVTRFSTENRHRTVGAGALVRPILGGFRRQKTELVVAITMRVVDVRSGEVVTTVTTQGTSGRRKLALGGLGLLKGAAGALSIGSSGFRDAVLDEALQRAVASAATGLVNAAPRLSRTRVGPGLPQQALHRFPD